MRIAVLGAGMVGQAHAKKLIQLGHDVVVGTNNPAKKKIDSIKVVSYSEAAKHGELIIEAVKRAKRPLIHLNPYRQNCKARL
jgi:predicted dinucleotide-binding enzyme